MIRPPASKLALAEHCVYPWNSGLRWPKREPMREDQRWGLAVHELLAQGPLAAGAIVAKYELTAEQAEDLATVAVHGAEQLTADSAQAGAMYGLLVEQGIAYDHLLGTARLVGAPRETTERETFGAVDLAFVRTNGVTVIRDWKSGPKAGNARPESLHQLRFLGLAFARYFETAEADIEIGHVTPEGIEISGARLTADDLREVEGDLWAIDGELRSAPRPAPGPWCVQAYCPLATVCPATRTALERVVGQLETYPVHQRIETPEHAAFMRHRLPLFEAWIAEKKREIQDVAKSTPLEVEGSPELLWGAVEHDGTEKIAGTHSALAVLREELGDEADKAAELDISKASVGRAVRAHLVRRYAGSKMPRGAIGQLEKDLLERLRSAGHVKRGAKYTRFEAFKRPVEGQPLEVVTYDGPEEVPEL